MKNAIREEQLARHKHENSILRGKNCEKCNLAEVSHKKAQNVIWVERAIQNVTFGIEQYHGECVGYNVCPREPRNFKK